MTQKTADKEFVAAKFLEYDLQSIVLRNRSTDVGDFIIYQTVVSVEIKLNLYQIVFTLLYFYFIYKLSRYFNTI